MFDDKNRPGATSVFELARCAVIIRQLSTHSAPTRYSLPPSTHLRHPHGPTILFSTGRSDANTRKETQLASEIWSAADLFLQVFLIFIIELWCCTLAAKQLPECATCSAHWAHGATTLSPAWHCRFRLSNLSESLSEGDCFTPTAGPI